MSRTPNEKPLNKKRENTGKTVMLMPSRSAIEGVEPEDRDDHEPTEPVERAAAQAVTGEERVGLAHADSPISSAMC